MGQLRLIGMGIALAVDLREIGHGRPGLAVDEGNNRDIEEHPRLPPRVAFPIDARQQGSRRAAFEEVPRDIALPRIPCRVGDHGLKDSRNICLLSRPQGAQRRAEGEGVLVLLEIIRVLERDSRLCPIGPRSQ